MNELQDRAPVLHDVCTQTLNITPRYMNNAITDDIISKLCIVIIHS